MIGPFVPEMFACATCGQRRPCDVLCAWTFQGSDQAWCIGCCGCDAHRQDVDPGGTVVFSGTPLTWRGLHRR